MQKFRLGFQIPTHQESLSSRCLFEARRIYRGVPVVTFTGWDESNPTPTPPTKVLQ